MLPMRDGSGGDTGCFLSLLKHALDGWRGRRATAALATTRSGANPGNVRGMAEKGSPCLGASGRLLLQLARKACASAQHTSSPLAERATPVWAKRGSRPPAWAAAPS